MYHISELHMGGKDCDYKLMDSTDCFYHISRFQKQEKCLKKKFVKIKI